MSRQFWVLGVVYPFLIIFILKLASLSSTRIQNIIKIQTYLSADIASLGPELGKVSCARVTKNRDYAMAWSKFPCKLDGSCTCDMSTV